MLTVKEWRKAKGISIDNMAKALKISPVTWMRWEENSTKIPIGKVYAFLEVVGADYSQVNFCLDSLQNVENEE